jgi:hypothetical protein
MLFFHIVDDYYLQGWLASAKQKTWWEKNAPNPLYKNDYKIALVEHAFSWTFMVHVPVIIYSIAFDSYIYVIGFVLMFVANVIIHAYIDDLKANKLSINLVTDQLLHIIQIILIWLLYVIAL